MCMGTKEDEIGTFKNLLDLYPSGILSVVSDTWDLWKVCTEYLPALKDQILARDGKLVIRPDSGDPVDIICGKHYPCNDPRDIIENKNIDYSLPENKGVIELLWDIFGGTVNEQGYKVLDSHIGAIYGDSITLERAEQICKRLKAKGFASTNIVLGIGSYTYQYNTRDTFGFAVKATYGELCSNPKADQQTVECREIFKDPITDDGTKKSAKGLLQVYQIEGIHGKSLPKLKDQCSWDEENRGMLTTVFKNGKLTRSTDFDKIRKLADINLKKYQ